MYISNTCTRHISFYGLHVLFCLYLISECWINAVCKVIMDIEETICRTRFRQSWYWEIDYISIYIILHMLLILFYVLHLKLGSPISLFQNKMHIFLHIGLCYLATSIYILENKISYKSGADPGFQVRGGALKKIVPSRGRHEIFGVFRVKNHDFTPKNHIFFNCRGRRENFWGISCEKSRFYAKKMEHLTY
jgi:hypothetical protein